MKNTVKLLSLFAALTLVFVFAGCSSGAGKTESTTFTVPDEGSTTSQSKPDERIYANVTVLSGTTGMGMAKLISENKAGTTALEYNFTVVSDATQISAGIIGGSIDIAAVPTNLASTLYNKTKGGIRVLALSNLGVLYILENGSGITNLSDLRGKTVFVPGQGTNPEYILKYILEKNGMTVGTDVMFDYTYSTPDTLSTAVAGGLAPVALLPEPKVTVVKSQNSGIRTAIDLSAEWDRISPAGSLAQGCIIARTDFINSHPEQITAFLDEYSVSVGFVGADPKAASELIAQAGIIPKAAIAEKAIPNCNIKYIDGDEMKNALSAFYGILFDVEPKSVGGTLPDDGLYYKR